MDNSGVLVATTDGGEMSLSQLENSNSNSVWVVNASPPSHRGDVIFECPRLHGTGADVVSVTKTWIPQDLTTQVPKAQLLASSHFRRSVRQGGLVKLVTPEFAEQVLKQPRAQMEETRLTNLKSAARTIIGSSTVTESESKTPTQVRREANLNKSVEEAEGVSIPKEVAQSAEDTKMQALLASLSNKTDPQEVLNAFMNEAGFTRRQYKAIIAHFDEVEGMEPVVQWAQDILERYRKG